MKPYFEKDGITLYHGDCREILPTLSGDVFITDPPYGVDLGNTKSTGSGHGLKREAYASYDDTYENYCLLVVPIIKFCVAKFKRGAVFVGQHIHEMPKPDAIGGVYSSAAVARTPWGFKNFLPVLLYGSAPNVNLGSKHTVIQSNALAVKSVHPCPKPIGWLKWLCMLASDDCDTIIDPFAGSGTTLNAAKECGRKAIGIEIEERYCELAANMLSQKVIQWDQPSVK